MIVKHFKSQGYDSDNNRYVIDVIAKSPLKIDDISWVTSIKNELTSQQNDLWLTLFISSSSQKTSIDKDFFINEIKAMQQQMADETGEAISPKRARRKLCREIMQTISDVIDYEDISHLPTVEPSL